MTRKLVVAAGVYLLVGLVVVFALNLENAGNLLRQPWVVVPLALAWPFYLAWFLLGGPR